jgi:hypothetical protein
LAGFEEQTWEQPIERPPQAAKEGKPKEEPVKKEKPVTPRQESALKNQDNSAGKAARPKDASVAKPVGNAPKSQGKPLSTKPPKSRKSDLDFIHDLRAKLKL